MKFVKYDAEIMRRECFCVLPEIFRYKEKLCWRTTKLAKIVRYYSSSIDFFYNKTPKYKPKLGETESEPNSGVKIVGPVDSLLKFSV